MGSNENVGGRFLITFITLRVIALSTSTSTSTSHPHQWLFPGSSSSCFCTSPHPTPPVSLTPDYPHCYITALNPISEFFLFVNDHFVNDYFFLYYFLLLPCSSFPCVTSSLISNLGSLGCFCVDSRDSNFNAWSWDTHFLFTITSPSLSRVMTLVREVREGDGEVKRWWRNRNRKWKTE